jgi:hypothetical protein
MERNLTAVDLPDLEIGTYVIIYEGEKPLDSGIVMGANSFLNTVDLKSTSDQSTSTFVFKTEIDAWFLRFEGLANQQCYNPKGPSYFLKETDRRIPIMKKTVNF